MPSVVGNTSNSSSSTQLLSDHYESKPCNKASFNVKTYRDLFAAVL